MQGSKSRLLLRDALFGLYLQGDFVAGSLSEAFCCVRLLAKDREDSCEALQKQTEGKVLTCLCGAFLGGKQLFWRKAAPPWLAEGWERL